MKFNLKELLETKNMSLYSLAKDTGISYSTLHRLIKDTKIVGVNFDTLEKICLSLDCEINELLILEK